MENKYFVVEIIVMEDGSVPHAISAEKPKNEAISQMHQVIASASINDNVRTAYAEVKDMYGNSIDRASWMKDVPNID